MSESSDGTKPLGRIQLQRKTVVLESPELATAQLLEAAPRELVGAVLELHGVPAIDLRRVIIPLSVLVHVDHQRARDALLLPLCEGPNALSVAMADPSEQHLLDELAFQTGRRVSAYLAVHGQLRDVIEEAYAAHAAGATQWRGTLASVGERETQPPPHPDYLPVDATASSAALKVTRFDAELSRPLLEELGGEASLPSLRPEPPPFPDVQRKRILVVDDSEESRRTLVRVLRQSDYEVIESDNGRDALEKVREHAPDLLMLEAMLPEVHGFDICLRIKGSRRYGHIPVVMLSGLYRGWRFAEDLHRAYGVDAFLEKPLRTADVLAEVARVLSGRSRSQSPADADGEGSGPAAVHLRAGIDAYQRGELAEAIGHLQQGAAIDPRAFRLHYHLGLLYGKQEKVFEAIQALEAAVALRPRDFATLKNLAVLYQRAGFRLKASEMWERALGSAPDDDTRSSIRDHLVSLL
jgi:DNA-binding response OmpR family regulator